MHDNNKEIFKFLNPEDNDMLSEISNSDLKEIIDYLNRYSLEYRSLLDIPSDVTFGIEIEMEHFKGGVSDFRPFEVAINKIVGNEDWTIKNDITLNWGRELASEMYTNEPKTWEDIKNVCELASKYGTIDIKCAGHVNIGSQIFGNNQLYWYRFLKLWTAYENVIYRFGYGEYLTYFPFILYSAKPIAKIFYERMDVFKKSLEGTVFDVIKGLEIPNMNRDFLKKNALSFIKMYGISDYSMVQNNCVVEIRNNLGTLDEVIWQNYNNFYIHLMLYCASNKFDDDLLDKRIMLQKDGFADIDGYNKIYLKQAIELCDLIFDNNLDKVYFLRQYLKNFEVSDKTLSKARKFTMTNR